MSRSARAQWGWNPSDLETMKQVAATVGLGTERVWHMNDAKAARGSKLDRHEQIGKGTMGLEPFRSGDYEAGRGDGGPRHGTRLAHERRQGRARLQARPA